MCGRENNISVNKINHITNDNKMKLHYNKILHVIKCRKMSKRLHDEMLDNAGLFRLFMI